jgi:hypothetical protein
MMDAPPRGQAYPPGVEDSQRPGWRTAKGQGPEETGRDTRKGTQETVASLDQTSRGWGSSPPPSHGALSGWSLPSASTSWGYDNGVSWAPPRGTNHGTSPKDTPFGGGGAAQGVLCPFDKSRIPGT